MAIIESLPLVDKIIGIIVTLIKSIMQLFSHDRSKIPKKTIKLVPQTVENRWSKGTMRGKPAIHLHSHWHITNISERYIQICRVVMKKPKQEGGILVCHPQRNIYGSYQIPPEFTTEATVSFWMQPPPKKKDKPVNISIEFIDQYDNSHKVRRVKFFPPMKDKEEEKQPVVEAISDISNPVEKEVAAVLQAELTRYQGCGHRVGGLGSIKTIYHKHTFKGVGTHRTTPDSSDQQIIAVDPENAKIESNNALTLVNYYKSLNDQQQKVFVDSMLSRLSRNKPYASIGYFILFLLYRVGHLKEALDVARSDLQGDSSHGFSDLLKLLSGLLRYEHPNFSDDMLDQVEQFLVDIAEHTFEISEKLSAVRAFKLSKSLEKEN